MSDQTNNLALPYILPSQAQKHVPHNEALQRLDTVVQLAIIAERQGPPETPAEGDRYLVGADPEGAWLGQQGLISVWQDGAWAHLSPNPGWRAFFLDTRQLRAFDGTNWNVISLDAAGSLPKIGINATADEINRLAIASEASLFTHSGQGHQLKINKADPSQTGTLLFQTNWSGRAEMGLAGDDDFSIKVSGDGNDWSTALVVAPDGVVRMPSRPIVRTSPAAGTVSPPPASRTGFTDIYAGQGGFELDAAVPSGSGARLIVPADGFYLLSLSVSTLTSQGHGVAIEINGTTVVANAGGPASASPARQSVSTIVELHEGDWLALLHSGTAQYEFGPAKTELCAVML
ncbi:DUF2793 domain-containing protein [Rhizobium sp. 2MFCol3.1]|uniref:DUF2793 domain-containing protein n=1 Tax=Rhizobium sp. 2MFCol3.1 TaxID=1246459 RepID=UPI00037C3A0B|nr:DUF2793 domain-containing protein [Rhizobium sp. 2MFCol3.1]